MIRLRDFAPLPQNIVDLFADGTEDRGALVFSGAPS